jgi:uncharacterized membrane protein
MKSQIRRVVQAVLFEVVAVAVVSPALSLIFEEPMGSSFRLAVLLSSVALVWNYIFNGWFERWESRQISKERTFGRRLLHGLGFEGGLVVMLVPIMAYWLNTSLLTAFIADLGLLVFFFVYTVTFTWAFDRVFGPPASAKARPEV